MGRNCGTLESAAAVLAFAPRCLAEGQIRGRHREPSESRAISRKQQLQSFLPQPQNRLDLSLGDTLTIKTQGVFYKHPSAATKACVTSGPGPQRGGLCCSEGTPKQPPLGSWCCPWCQTLFLPAKSSCNAHTRVFVHAGDHALACARAACVAGERHTGGPSSHAGARGVVPHHASGERGDKPTENQAVGRQGWMPMHSTETPQHLVNAFLAMILLSERNPLESCDPDPPL